MYIVTMLTALNTPPLGDAIDLRLGPLRYRLIARDAWGNQLLRAIADNLTGSPGQPPPNRTVLLDEDLGRRAPADWQRHSSPLGTLWEQPGTTLAVWTAGASNDLPPFRYQLPWALVIADIARCRGAVAHAGFAARNDRALLFLAPPGGGKSTTLASAPSDWEVLSDDAALVWPEAGEWLASPLPSWTMMTAAGSGQRPAEGFNPGRRRRLYGLIVLAKGTDLVLQKLSAVAAVPHLYRALHEYPSTVLVNPPLKEQFFRSASALARALPCWHLQLPLGADVWPSLAQLLTDQP